MNYFYNLESNHLLHNFVRYWTYFFEWILQFVTWKVSITLIICTKFNIMTWRRYSKEIFIVLDEKLEFFKDYSGEVISKIVYYIVMTILSNM